jgi:hypothetical protein
MLLNVRLREEEASAVRGLRRAKVNVSELVRRALRDAAAGQRRVKAPRSTLVAEVLAAHPGPRDKAKRPPLDDRRAVSDFITRKLARK